MPGQNSRSFAERVALVTGGARGVGRAVALQLALEGAFVIVSYPPSDAEGERVAGELRELGTLAHAFGCDVSRAAEVRGLFAFVDETYGRLDMLVNCAGVSRRAPLDALTEEDWNDVLDVTLRGAFLCSQAAARLMRRRPSPSIVNVAADAGQTGHAYGAHTVAAHTGLVGLTKALARELYPRIRVNCVTAAVGASELEAETRGHQHEPENASEMPASGANVSQTARPPAPDEVARACIYLLSSEAGAVTGQTLFVGV